jgi:PGF-CTERM protein
MSLLTAGTEIMFRTDSAAQRVATLGVLILAIAVATAGVAAVSGITVTQLTSDEVESGQSATHTLSFEADGVSADGAADTIYVELPNTYADNMSFSTVSFVNRSSGETVPVSSSTNIVDGPDGDGVRETLRTKISHDADYPTDDVNATYEFGLSHPSVAETTQYDVSIEIVDSETGNTSTTVEDAITVLAGGMEMTTDGGGMDDMETDDETTAMTDGSSDSGSGSGPGFGAVAAVLAVVGSGALLRRRS